MTRRSAARAREILEARAIALARPPEDRSERETLEVLRFTRGEESFGVETRYVHAVFRMGAVALLPGVPPSIAGAAAWRGGVLVLLEPGRGTAGSWGQAVVALGEARPEFGLVADDLEGVVRIPVEEIGPPGALGAERPALRGMTRDGLLLLDGDVLIRTQTKRGGR